MFFHHHWNALADLLPFQIMSAKQSLLVLIQVNFLFKLMFQITFIKNFFFWGGGGDQNHCITVVYAKGLNPFCNPQLFVTIIAGKKGLISVLHKV